MNDRWNEEWEMMQRIKKRADLFGFPFNEDEQRWLDHAERLKKRAHEYEERAYKSRLKRKTKHERH